MKSYLLLVLASVFWGFGFVAAAWTIRYYTPVEAVSYRFFLATVFGFIFLFVGRQHVFNRKDFILSLPAGLLLGLMQLTQTIGLVTTTVGKSGFITSLYVVFVPILSVVILKNKNSLRMYILAFIALLGTALLVKTDFTSMNAGDLWTLICALLAALQIIYIGVIAKGISMPFRFNTYQSFWSFVLIVPFLFLQKNINILTTDSLSIVGLLFLCFGSSILAFYFQIKAQRFLSASTTSLVSLLESPVAALFSFLLLNEVFDLTQIAGALLIIMTSLLTL
jgi:drug/metabolite transporter (DMT)-like permease